LSNTIIDVKRFIGRKFDEQDVQREIQYSPNKIVKTADGSVGFEVQYDDSTVVFTPEQVVGMLLGQLQRTVEAETETKGGDCVISVCTTPRRTSAGHQVIVAVAVRSLWLAVCLLLESDVKSSCCVGSWFLYGSPTSCCTWSCIRCWCSLYSFDFGERCWYVHLRTNCRPTQNSTHTNATTARCPFSCFGIRFVQGESARNRPHPCAVLRFGSFIAECFDWYVAIPLWCHH
jgi:hypothetical protein